MSDPIRTLRNCTVRVEGLRAAGGNLGTGFFYSFQVLPPSTENPGGLVAPALITNKHVVEACDRIRVQLSVSSNPADLNEFGVPRDRRNFMCELNVAEGVARHPNPNVDLCAIPFGPIVSDLIGNRGLHIWHAFLGRNMVVEPNERGEIRAIEPIAMVGYPIGMWDSVNNVALVRQGSTATHPFVHYEGRPEFVIDAACFPGSSGSPVFLFQDGMFRNRGGNVGPGTRVALLGILWGGPQFTASGQLEVRPIPQTVPVMPVPVTSIPMNLGYVIHADEIEALRSGLGIGASTAPLG